MSEPDEPPMPEDSELVVLCRIARKRSARVCDRLDALGAAIDRANSLQDPQTIGLLIYSVRDLTKRELSATEQTQLNYFIGTAHSALSTLTQKDQWDWERPHSEKALLYLKRAIAFNIRASPNEWNPEVILTNIANELSQSGRPISAIGYWRDSLTLSPGFGPAQLNYAVALDSLTSYPIKVHDKHLLIDRAKELLSQAEKSQAIDEHGMRSYLEEVKKRISSISFKEHTPREKSEPTPYQEWCMKNRLYLNIPGATIPKVATPGDPFHLDSIRSDIDMGLSPWGIFNVIKREYASARLFTFQSLRQIESPDERVDLFLVDTLDFPMLSHQAECGKAAYRMAYSLLERIAIFLKIYFNLSVDENEVSFRNVWYIDGKRDNGLRPEFDGVKNWPLRGLFWVSKEIYEVTPGFHETTDPDSKRLDELRNRIEHQYVALHILPHERTNNSGRTDGTVLGHPIGYQLSWFEFRRLLLVLLGLSQEAILYLGAAVAVQQKITKQEGVPSLPIQPLDSSYYDLLDHLPG